MNTPQTESNQRFNLMSSKKFWGKAIWVSVILMIVPPLLSTMGTTMGMVRALKGIGQTGEENIQEWADNISLAIQIGVWGLVVSCVALTFFLVALTFYLKRSHSLRKFF